jgi:hypothetical protein
MFIHVLKSEVFAASQQIQLKQPYLIIYKCAILDVVFCIVHCGRITVRNENPKQIAESAMLKQVYLVNKFAKFDF